VVVIDPQPHFRRPDVAPLAACGMIPALNAAEVADADADEDDAKKR
jgi:hypothetical protein